MKKEKLMSYINKIDRFLGTEKAREIVLNLVTKNFSIEKILMHIIMKVTRIRIYERLILIYNKMKEA